MGKYIFPLRGNRVHRLTYLKIKFDNVLFSHQDFFHKIKIFKKYENAFYNINACERSASIQLFCLILSMDIMPSKG